MNTELIMLGIGSHHGNDRIAWDLIDALKEKFDDGEQVQFIKCQRTPFDFWGELQPCREVVVLDAVLAEPHPGKIYRVKLEHSDDYFIGDAAGSSHNVGILTALKLAQQLSLLPKQVEIWAVGVDRLANTHSHKSLLTGIRYKIILQTLNILVKRKINKITVNALSYKSL